MTEQTVEERIRDTLEQHSVVLFMKGTSQFPQCGFSGKAVEILKACIADLPDGAWLRGGQWNDALLASGKTPKTILDDIAPDRPVFL